MNRREFNESLACLAGLSVIPFELNSTYETEDEVVDFETIINEVALLRNRWLGVMKGLETKQWQMGHIVRLRTAGMEDIQV